MENITKITEMQVGKQKMKFR